eukprot:11206787-Karenia_brevis.AAC.1
MSLALRARAALQVSQGGPEMTSTTLLPIRWSSQKFTVSLTDKSPRTAFTAKSMDKKMTGT